jgi:uncharacterized membrane protein YkvA (DUF1232 family)
VIRVIRVIRSRARRASASGFERGETEEMPDMPSIRRPFSARVESPRKQARTTVARTIARIPSYVRLLVGTLRDSRVSRIDRALVVASIAYVLSPLDFIPDVIPFLGQVDDVFLIALALTRLFDQAPREVVLEHWDHDPVELSGKSLKRLLYASSFFLPFRMRRRLRVFAKG